jgi:hypothetical protein
METSLNIEVDDFRIRATHAYIMNYHEAVECVMQRAKPVLQVAGQISYRKYHGAIFSQATRCSIQSILGNGDGLRSKCCAVDIGDCRHELLTSCCLTYTGVM